MHDIKIVPTGSDRLLRVSGILSPMSDALSMAGRTFAWDIAMRSAATCLRNRSDLKIEVKITLTMQSGAVLAIAKPLVKC
jgi:hypothetical protein